MTANGQEVFFGSAGNVLKLDCRDAATAVNILKIIDSYTQNK